MKKSLFAACGEGFFDIIFILEGTYGNKKDWKSVMLLHGNLMLYLPKLIQPRQSFETSISVLPSFVYCIIRHPFKLFQLSVLLVRNRFKPLI